MDKTLGQIAELIKQAGWTGIYTTWAEPTGKPDWSPVKESLTVPVTMEQIERFASLVAAAVKEEDARICEELEVGTDDEIDDLVEEIVHINCAKAIRASIKEVKS